MISLKVGGERMGGFPSPGEPLQAEGVFNQRLSDGYLLVGRGIAWLLVAPEEERKRSSLESRGQWKGDEN